MELVDTHCHLQFEPYKRREDEVIAAASLNGVKHLLCVGTTLDDSKLAVELAQQKKNVWASVGVHPHAGDNFAVNKNSEKELKKIAASADVVAIGETGFDLYRSHSTVQNQELALRAHIKVAQELNLPVIFHVRDAWRDFWRVMDDYQNLRGVIHSFSSGPKQLDEVLRRGFYVGLNGILTFSRDDSQLNAARAVPLNKLVLETDAPFLTPAPNRNELCEPKHVRITAEFLANLREEKLEDLAQATTQNAKELFKLHD